MIFEDELHLGLCVDLEHEQGLKCVVIKADGSNLVENERDTNLKLVLDEERSSGTSWSSSEVSEDSLGLGSPGLLEDCSGEACWSSMTSRFTTTRSELVGDCLFELESDCGETLGGEELSPLPYQDGRTRLALDLLMPTYRSTSPLKPLPCACPRRVAQPSPVKLAVTKSNCSAISR